MTRAREPVHIEPKGWGREVWIANNSLYCGKILEIRKGRKCSLHFHKLKTESFYLRSGRLKVRIKDSADSDVIDEFEMTPGQCMDVPPVLSIRWKHSKMPNCSSSPQSTLTAIRIG